MVTVLDEKSLSTFAAGKDVKSPEPVQLNNITINLYSEGAGPPVMLLHGFPDSLKEWRFVIPHLLSAGYRVIAYDQRGFGESDAPENVSAYRIENIANDAVAVIQHLGVTERIRLVGHDWGAFIGWYLCLAYPHLFESYVAISVGHPLAYRHAGWEQRKRGWYVLAWQLRGVAEYLIAANDWAALRRVAGKRSEIENWIADLSRRGRLTAGLNWYRANFFQLLARKFSTSTVPTCGIYSTGDVALTAKQMIDSQRYVSGKWKYIQIEDSSHWIPLDKPDELAAHLCNWFAAVDR